MSSFRKFTRKNKLKQQAALGLGALSLAAALGITVYPMTANAVGIERVDGGVMESSGNTHNIYASEVRNTIGVNRFGKFNLEENNIANMYFHTKNNPGAEASNLLNFVADKINVNGTINAIRNNKIGGNLYFLSKEGLVVGKTGVINAGTFNMYTRNESYQTNEALFKDFDQIVNMKEDLNRLNDDAKIEVYGQINTVDGLRLKAGSVIIGGTQSQGLAALKSGVVDFSNVVNIKNGSTEIKSGLTGDQLKATRANNGDIVLGANYDPKGGFKNGTIQLRAYADTRNAYDKNYNPLATSVSGNNVVRAEVQINEGSAISAYGDVNLTAEASYGKGLSGIFGTDIESANVMDLLGKAAKTEALITVNGNMKAGVDAVAGGKGSVTMKANTTNNFAAKDVINVSRNLMQQGEDKLLGWLFKGDALPANISYANIEADALISVGEKADIQALNDVNISTNSKIKSNVGTKKEVDNLYLAQYEEQQKQGTWSDFIDKYAGRAGIAINNTTNVSKIALNGKVKAGEVQNTDGSNAQGKGSINAKAESDVVNLASAKIQHKKGSDPGEQGNGVKVALVYSSMNNTTDITVNGELTAVSGKINLESSGTSSVTTSAEAKSGDGGTYATTAINIDKADTKSTITVNGKLNAAKGIDIESTNETDMCGDASTEAKWNAETMAGIYGEGSKAEYEGLSNMFDGIYRDAEGALPSNYKEMLAAGIAFNWGDFDISSAINVGAGAELNVPKDATTVIKDKDGKEKTVPAGINLNATSSITDFSMQAFGSSTKGEKSTDEDTKLISGAVLINNVKNDATINIAGGEGGKAAPVINAPVVNISAEATNDWDRINGMLDYIDIQFNMAMDVFKYNINILKLLQNCHDKMQVYSKNPSEENLSALCSAIADLKKIATTATYKNFTKLDKSIFDATLTAAWDMVAANNYANTYVTSSATSDADEQAKFALSGAVSVNNFTNKANVIIGSGAQISATKGDVEISSTSSQNMVNLAGPLYEFDTKDVLPKGESAATKYLHDHLPSLSLFPTLWAGNDAKNLIGGNVIVTNNYSQALTVIGAGAKISGNSVTLGADNFLANSNIILAGGSAGSIGITGMGSYDGGSSNSIVSVASGAQITADGEGEDEGSLEIAANNKNILTAIVGNLSTSDSKAAGASLGIVNYDINTISTVADNAKASLTQDDKLHKILNASLNDVQKNYLGTSSEKGLLKAAQNVAITAKDTGVINTITVAGVSAGGVKDDKQGQQDAEADSFLDKLDVAAAGSVSVNTITSTTLAGADGADITVADGDASVKAEESKYVGAYSGAAALKMLNVPASDNAGVTLSGSVGVNKGSQEVAASLKNSTVSAQNIDNRALKQGTSVAVGLAYGQTKVKTGSLGAQFVGSGSGISLKNNVSATLDKVTVNNADSMVKNIAQNKDVQVAGGVSANYAKDAKVGIGASATYLNTANTVNASVKSSQITAKSLESLAVSKTTQVGGAVTAGVMTGEGVKVGVNGAVVTNTLTNTSAASITGSEISTDELRVRAYDGNLTELDTKDAEKEVTDTTENASLKVLKEQGFNVDAVESTLGDKVEVSGTGNRIISAALGVNADISTDEDTAANVGAGVAVSVNKIKNSFSAGVDNSTIINKNTASIDAKSNAALLNVSAVAGVTVSTGVGTGANVSGGGNVAVNNVQADVKAVLDKANVTTGALAVTAQDAKKIQNYAGTLNFAIGQGASATLGVSVGVNNLSGNTIAQVDNSTLNLNTASGNALIAANSTNDIKNVIITAGAVVSGSSIALSGAGTVAANNVSGETKATMTNSDFNAEKADAANDLSITADDVTTVSSVVGNGTVSLAGGSLAAQLGAGADKISFARNTVAELVGKTDKNTINARNLNVKANSTQDLSSYAVGVGGAVSGTAAGSLNGAVSTEKNTTITSATIENITGKVDNINVDAQHTNKLNRFNLGAALSGGQYSASAGFNIGVLNDSSETRANFKNNKLITTGDININAANDTTLKSNVNTAALAVSLGAGVGANIVVDDFTNKVSVDVDNNQIGDADHVANSFNAAASNKLTDTSEQGTATGAFVTGSVGVGVFTTNTSVTNNLSNNTIYAHNIIATANEQRNFDNKIINGNIAPVGISISALINNVGAAVDDKISYVIGNDGTKDTQTATADIDSVLNLLDKALVEQDNYITDKGTLGALTSAGLTQKDTQNNVKVSRGTAASEGVQLVSSNNKLYSDGGVKLVAKETTNMTEKNYQGGINGIGINIAVSKAKVNNKVGASVTDTTIDAITKVVTEKDKDGKEVTRTIISARPDVVISSAINGAISNNAWQGGISGVAINTVYAGTWINNENSVGISKSNIISSKMNILAQDALHNTVNTFGTSNGLLTGGALYATAQSKSKNLITIDNAKLFAGMDAKNNIFSDAGELLIKAEKSNKVKAKVTAGAVAAVSGKGMVATAIDGEENDSDTQGSVSTVNITNSNLKAGKAITATASKLLDVQAVINSWEAGLGGTANGAIAHAYATGAANMLSGDGNSFATGESVTLQSLIDKGEDSEHSLSADMAANNGGILGVSVNEAKTVYNVLANTQANEAVYKAQNLTIRANHNVDVYNSAQGVEVGLAVASGTMAAHATTNALTHIDAKGAKYATSPDTNAQDSNTVLGESSDLGDVDISANTLVQENITAKGNGGGLLDISPVAAKLINKLTTDTVVNVSGSWLLNGNFTVDALNQDNVTQNATSTKVGVVGGYGGVQNYDVTKHNAKVNIGSTDKETTIITTDGLQLYQAGNIVKHHGSNDASGGGILDGSASDLATKYNDEATKFTSSVSFDNAKLTTEGVECAERSYTTDATENSSIKAQAFTEADLSYDNKLNGVGIIYSGVWNKSEHDITYDNSVNVKNNSLLTTKDRKQDITLAAYDKSTVNINTVASSGALAASAYGRSNANLLRNAKVNIDKTSALDSAYNTYINAGADLNGISSTFDYTVNTESYNKSLIPAGTSDKMENKLSQNNQLDIAGAVTTVHNAYLVANGGSSNVKKSSKRYTIYTGTKTNEELTSVEAGEIDDKQTTNNFVNVTGRVIAGTHSGLDLTIAGNLTIGKDAQGHDEFKYDDLKVTVGSGSDWFKADSIKPGEVEVKNALLESYTKIQNAMSGYAEDSAEYKALAAELDTLFKDMATNGFVVEGTDEKGEKVAVILDSRYMPSIEIPDIYVSGGNIHITADDLQGNGTLEAKGVNNLNITNNSNTNMIINDVVIEEAGGRVTFNGKNADANNKGHFAGEIKTSTDTAEPAITIKSTGNADDKIKKYTNADITILGKLQNIEGKIDINNTYRNINIAGDAAISAQTIAINAGGSVTQNSTGFTSVGSDPIARYQFNEEIAKKIQQYIAYLIKNGKADEFKADSYEDYCDYLLNHASAINLSAVEQETIRTAKANYIKMKNGEIDNGIVAGSNVYINARNLNIDGLVQSGYDNYHVEYTDGMKERINELDKKYAAIANKDALTDSDVLGNSEFLINYTDGKASGGATYDSTGKKYTYEIKMYYNPSTKEIVSEKIETNGGKIYLTGAISSMGNGRLLAMSGTADVSLDLSKATDANQRDLNVSDIKINDVAGLISIRDTAQSKQTTYKVAGDKVERTTYDIDAQGNIGNAKTELVDKAGLVYNPKAGTTISWTGGTNGGQTVTTKGYNKIFVGWGLIKWGQTEDFIQKVTQSGGKIDTISKTTTGDGSTLANGVLIGSKGGSGFSVSGDAYNSSKYYGPVSYENEYDGIAGKIFGYGTTHYTWKEYEGGSTSSTSTIKADAVIGVGFMEGSKGTISVKNSGNVNVAGWLQNASKNVTNTDGTTTAIGVGSIDLASTNGSIFAFDGARLVTDNLAASAYDDIYIYDHNAIGDNAKINLNAQTGNIIFNSDKGNVQLAGAGAANGWYVLDAAGDITTAKNADGTYTNEKIIGKYIGLTSKGKVDVRVDAGTDMGEWFDNGLTIEAEGDIKVYHNENNKDLLIGEIISNNGDVYMETNNSFVDANDDNTLSDAEDKVKHWQEMGIISAADTADSKTNAAKEDKDAALADANAKLTFLARGEKDTNAKVAEYQDAAQGLQKAFSEYRAALKNAKTTEERATAAQAYASEKAHYFATLGKAYSTDEQSAIINYAEASFTDNYGWSANDLIYAIQKDVLNSAPGQTVLGDTANITGHKITLKAGSGIGVDAAAETIAAGTLNKLENLKKLAQAKSGDLTWHDDGSVTIRKQQPLLLNVLDKTDADGKVTKGSVDLDATNNVYIAGIKDTHLNINGSIDTKGDIKLMADKGITASDMATLSGRNLTLYGGAGDVGSADSLLNISRITGSLNANTDREHGVYIQKTKDSAGSDTKLTIEAITTGNLVLKSATGMDWTQEAGKTNGYIDAASISLTATDGTNIGEANSALRILNNDAVINASGSNIYLQGVNDAGKIGSLTAQNLFVDNELVFNSEGNIKLAGGVDADGNKLIGKLAKRTVDASGKESYSAVAKATLSSTGGSIVQENYYQILADTLSATAQGDVLLESGAQNADESKLYNELGDVTIGSASGKILLANGGDKDLTITIAQVGDAGLAESIDLHNYKNGNVNKMTVANAMHAKGDISVTQDEEALLTVGTQKADITSEEGDIFINGAKGIVVGNEASNGQLTAKQGNITVVAENGDLYNHADITAEKGAAGLIALKGNVKNTGKAIKAAGISIAARDDINFDDQYQQNLITSNPGAQTEGVWGAISIVSLNGSVNLYKDTNINAKGNVWLQGHIDITIGSKGSGDKGDIISQNGDITLLADTGNVSVSSIGSVKADNGKVSLISSKGTIYNEGSIEGKGVLLDAYNDLSTKGSQGTITATGTGEDDKLEIVSHNGSVTLTDDTTLLAANDIVIDAEKDVINNMNHDESHKGGLYTENGDIFITSNAGNIVNNNDLLTDKGNIYLRSLAGTIDNNGTIAAGNGAFLNAYVDLNINKDTSVTGEVKITANGKNGLSFVSSNGSVTFGDGVLVASNADINVLAQNDIVNNNNTSGSSAGHTWNGLLAKGTIDMTAQNGSIENNAGLLAWYGDVKLSAENGSITNTATTVSAGKDLLFTAKNIASGTETKKANLKAQKGKIELVATDENITSYGDIEADANVSLTAKNDVNSTGNITAQGNVSLAAENGSVSSTGNVQGKDIDFVAGKGVYNNGAVTAAGKLIFTAQDVITSKGDLQATEDLLISAKETITSEGNLKSTSGNINITSSNGSISSSGSLDAHKDVTLNASGYVKTIGENNKIHGANVFMTAANGNVINNNTIEAENDITMNAYRDVTNKGALKAKNGFVKLTAQMGSLSNASDITAGKEIFLGALNDVTNKGALSAGADVQLLAINGALTSEGNLTSTSGDIALNAKGDVKITASEISASDGDVTITSDAGSVKLNKDTAKGTVTAKDVSLDAAQNIYSNSDITASGNVDMEAEAGTLTNTGAITADANITLTAQGVLANKGALQSKNADVELQTKAGNLTNESSINAKQNILLKTLAALTNSGELQADADVTLDALGQLSNTDTAKVTAGKNISFTASGNDGAGTASINNSGELLADGNVTLDGFFGVKNTKSITSTNGSVEIISDNNDVINEGDIKAHDDVNITAGDNLTNSGAVTSSVGGINFTAQDEALTNTGALSAKDDISLVAEKSQLSNSGIIKSSEGNVLLDGATTVENTKTITAQDVVAIIAAEKVTNSGALTSNDSDIYIIGGDITNAASASAANGDIIFKGKHITQSKGTLTSGHKDATTGETVLGNVEFIARGTINNSSVINTTGDISFEGVSITNNAGANLTAGDDITFNASGAISNKAEIKADNDVDFTAGDKLENTGTVTAADDIHFTAGSDITNSGALNAQDDIILSAGKNISNTNTSKLTTEGNVSFTAGEKISNASDIDTESINMSAGTDIDNDGALLSADSDITMTAKGNIENDAEMVSVAGDIKLTAKNITQKQPVTAHFGEVDMTADSTDGTINITNVKGVTDVIKGILGVNLTAGGKITSTSGNINAGFTGEEEGKPFECGDVVIRSLNDTIDYAGNIIGVNVTLEAANDITIDGSKNSTIQATGKLKEDDALTISSTKGSVTINNGAKLDAANDLIIKAQKNITNNFGSSDAGLTAGKDIMLITKTGDIDNNGKITAAKGDVLLKAEQGSIDNDADITGKSLAVDAYNDLHIDASSGHAYKAIGTEAGDALSFISRNGNVVIDKDAKFDAGKDIIISAKKNVANGMIISATDRTPGHDLIADNGSITIIAEDGIVYNNAKIRAKENVGIYGGTYILNAGSVDATGTNENEGNIFFQANNDIWQLNGGVKGTNNVVLASLIGNITLMDNVTSVNGSVAVVANGDVDAVASDIHKLLEIKAKEGAYLISNNGNINADKVSAKDITYAANSDEHTKADGTTVKSTLKVKQTHVGETLDITGNNVYLHETAHPGSGIYDPDDCYTEHGIWQTGDSDTLYLKLATAKNSAGAYVPADNLVLNFHKINGTLDIDKLWVNNIDLKIPADGLNIHKLAVAGRADISTNKMHSTIYGKAPQRTDADTIFWQHYDARNPGLSEELWNSWNDDADTTWMNLFFHRDGVRQTSNNSVLLHKRDYRYVYNQRYSAEDWLLYRTLFDESGHRGDLSIVPLYERYDLLDYEEDAATEKAVVKVE